MSQTSVGFFVSCVKWSYYIQHTWHPNFTGLLIKYYLRVKRSGNIKNEQEVFHSTLLLSFIFYAVCILEGTLFKVFKVYSWELVQSFQALVIPGYS